MKISGQSTVVLYQPITITFTLESLLEATSLAAFLGALSQSSVKAIVDSSKRASKASPILADILAQKIYDVIDNHLKLVEQNA